VGPYLLAIDQGTTTCRAVVYDLEGRLIAQAYREVYPYHPQPGWAEADPQDWWQATVAVVHEVLDQSGVSPSDIAAIGISALQHAIVPVDREGKPLARAMLWMDQRCAPQVEWMIRQHGETIRRVMGEGRFPTTTYSAPKLRWWVEKRPEVVHQAAVFLLPKDYLRYRLTGEAATDPSDAGGAFLYHPTRHGWATELLELIGVPVQKMPPIRQPYEIVGRVKAAAAAETGLAQGTPVVVGCADTLSTLIGANALLPERGYLYLGTAAWLALSDYSRPYVTTYQRPPASIGRKVPFGSVATTGAALRWFRDLFLPTPAQPGVHPQLDYTSLMAQAEQVEPGAEGLIFLPHLMGERATNDPQAKGVFLGLTLAHGRAHLLRALLEGTAFVLRQLLDQSGYEPPQELLALGGGAKSPLWCQIMADVMNIPMLVPRVVETTSLGAAILAGVGVGLYPSVAQAAARVVHIVGRHDPRPRWRARYDAMYALYRQLDESLTPFFRRVPVSD
jgi:xylulokinase